VTAARLVHFPAFVDPVTFAQNVYALVGCWIWVFFLVLLAILAWTAAKMLAWRAEKEHYAIRARREKIGPDGQPYPPTGRGICAACSRTFEKVFVLPSGQKLCRDCYHRRIGRDGQ